MAKLRPTERTVNACGMCGKLDTPLAHINHEDYEGWVCGACIAERWPGLVAMLEPLRQFVERSQCS